MERQPDRPSTPTEPGPSDIPRQTRARIWRRVFVVALAAFLALGALGLYGVRTTSVSGSGGGYALTVRYASISRPGLATPWAFEVTRAGGFPEGLTVGVRSSYFDAFDENGLGPAPAEETTDGKRTFWHFAPTTAETIDVSFDARIEPGVQLSRVKGQVDVLSGRNGPVAVSATFTTFVMP